MKKADIRIANSAGVYRITVEGRATFECCPPLRQLARTLEREDFDRVDINLQSCTAMDSTFMGILAMLGLRARKVNATMRIIKASPANVDLLDGLGLKKLFVLTNEADDAGTQGTSVEAGTDMLDRAKTVLDAHEALMKADEENVAKFEKVVELTKDDLDRLEKKKEDSES